MKRISEMATFIERLTDQATKTPVLPTLQIDITISEDIRAVWTGIVTLDNALMKHEHALFGHFESMTASKESIENNFADAKVPVSAVFKSYLKRQRGNFIAV